MNEDRLNAKLIFTNKAGKVTVLSEINDLSKLDAAILQVELSEAIKRVAEKQILALQNG